MRGLGSKLVSRVQNRKWMPRSLIGRLSVVLAGFDTGGKLLLRRHGLTLTLNYPRLNFQWRQRATKAGRAIFMRSGFDGVSDFEASPLC